MTQTLMTSPIHRNSRVLRADGPVSSDLQGEVVILEPERGIYFGLNDVGAAIWHFIGEEHSVSEIMEMILAAYNVGPERCETDVLKILADLKAAGLITIDAPIV